jgi:hypothetical protein
MVIQERKIFSCTEMALKMIQNTKKGYFHTCSRSKLRFLVMLIALLVFKKLKKELAELLDGKNWA